MDFERGLFMTIHSKFFMFRYENHYLYNDSNYLGESTAIYCNNISDLHAARSIFMKFPERGTIKFEIIVS